MRQRNRPRGLDAPAQQAKGHQANRHGRQQARQIGRVCCRQAAQQPEGDRRQLVVRVGEKFQEPDTGTKQRANDDAGKDQHQNCVTSRDCCSNLVDDQDRRQPAEIGCRFDRQDRQ
jgi:hypothetical protein